MSTRIFADMAPRYWERGYRVIPTKPGSKQPSLANWTGFLSDLPNIDTRSQLLETYETHGIGLLLGSPLASGGKLVALDVDGNELVRLVRGLLTISKNGSNPIVCGKVGKRGATYFCNAPKDNRIKNTTLKGAGDLGNIDILGPGKMTVMPPSIHPDTGRPYEVVGSDLLEANTDFLPTITAHLLDVIGAAIGSEHAKTLLSGGPTHEAGVAWTAQMVSAGADDEEIKAALLGLLPVDYAGNSLEELPGWIRSAREKGFDSPKGRSRKISPREAALSAIMASGIKLFNDGEGEAYAAFSSDDQNVTVRISSTACTLRLRKIIHETLGQTIGTATLADVSATLAAVALFDGNRHSVFSRVAGDLNRVEFDLGDPSGQVVEVTPSGWDVRRRSNHHFVRSSGMLALPVPKRGGSLRDLQELLCLNDESYILVAAFILSALRPKGPYPILLIEGEQGSGKSFLAETIKMIVDPNKASKLRLPDNDRDLMIHAKEMHLLGYDNASGMKGEISDALCSLATGGGIAVRRLYTDSDLNVLTFCRPVLINGISGYVSRPDLMERAFPVRLPPMGANARRSEDDLRPALAEKLPGILGALLDAVATAMRVYPEVTPPKGVRMIDAMRWVVAGEAGLGIPPGAALRAIIDAQTGFVIQRVTDDALVIRLREVVLYRPFEGHIGDLFGRLRDGERSDPALPRSPSILSRALERLRPAAALAGLHIEFGEKDRRGRPIRIWSEDQLAMPKNI